MKLLLSRTLCLKGTSLLSIALGLLLYHSLAATNAAKDVRVIVPGQSVGLLHLGDIRDRVFGVFPRQPDADQDTRFGFGGTCATEEVISLDRVKTKEGFHVKGNLFIYLKDNRVFQIEATTGRFQTSEGIGPGSEPSEVKARYADLASYELQYSASPIAGNRDIVYWVSVKMGIAFEFHYDQHSRHSLVYGVSIFSRGKEFLPKGCILPPQKWLNLPPYSLGQAQLSLQERQ